jgi:hypothetical protein
MVAFAISLQRGRKRPILAAFIHAAFVLGYILAIWQPLGRERELAIYGSALLLSTGITGIPKHFRVRLARILLQAMGEKLDDDTR